LKWRRPAPGWSPPEVDLAFDRLRSNGAVAFDRRCARDKEKAAATGGHSGGAGKAGRTGPVLGRIVVGRNLLRVLELAARNRPGHKHHRQGRTVAPHTRGGRQLLPVAAAEGFGKGPGPPSVERPVVFLAGYFPVDFRHVIPDPVKKLALHGLEQPAIKGRGHRLHPALLRLDRTAEQQVAGGIEPEPFGLPGRHDRTKDPLQPFTS